MKRNKTFIYLSLVILMTLIAVFSYNIGYNEAVDDTVPLAVDAGWNSAIDSVENILKRQVKSDTSTCTYLCIDTAKYYLSRRKSHEESRK